MVGAVFGCKTGDACLFITGIEFMVTLLQTNVLTKSIIAHLFGKSNRKQKICSEISGNAKPCVIGKMDVQYKLSEKTE